MTREIKFRVWSEEDKEYRTDCRLTEIFTIVTGTPSTVYSDGGDRFDIEQYTGLKDKNEKEIYEGDILSYKFVYDKRFRAHGYVVWGMEEAGFVVVNLNGLDRIAVSEGIELYNYSKDSQCQVEVVGNIHENPELLEEKR